MSFGRFLEDEKTVREDLDELREMARRPGHLTVEQRDRLIEFPGLFRRLCHALSLAKHRDYSTSVVSRLNREALLSHHQMYTRSFGLLGRVGRFVTHTFPQTLRAESWLMFWSCLMLFGVGVAIGVIVQFSPEIAYSVLGADGIASMEEMYDSGDTAVRVGRAADSDVATFGFYIWNNISIAFRLCASGVLFGIGSIFFLSYNGLVIGAVFGHLYRIGAADNLASFAVGHGSFELIAFAVAGVAGLMLGRALVSPGRRTRGDALRAVSQNFTTLAVGAGGMLVIAAFIEAFWSPRVVVSHSVKYAVGGVLWTTLIAYFVFAGRGRRGS